MASKSNSGRKTKFNKKEGFRFALLSRSQQDPLLHEGGSEQVLHPLDRKTLLAMETGAFEPEGAITYQSQYTAANKRSKSVNGIQETREVDELGFKIDGYDYSQHLSSVGEGGTFIGSNGVEISGRLQFDKVKAIPSEVFASEDLLPRRVDLEAILLAPELMDEDMKQQLEAEVEDEEGEGEEDAQDWADDFMGQLLAPAPEDEERRPMTSKLVQGFDFESHMTRLMQKPSANMVEGDFEDMGEYDEEEDEYEEEEIFETEEDADAHFAKVLAEYEELGDVSMEDEEEEGGGESATQAAAQQLSQSDPIVLRALKIYSQDQEDDTSLGEVGLPPSRDEVLRFVRPETLVEEEGKPLEAPKLEGYMAAWTSTEAKEKPRFDCETIVSTRSTTDNLPNVISLPQRKKKASAAAALTAVHEAEEEEGEEEMLSRMAERMRLQQEEREEEEEDAGSEPQVKSLLGDSTKRKRGETAEEKRKRKAQLKDEKRERRAEKKQVKFMYKEERKQVVSCLTARNAPLPGVSEFKI